MYELELKSLEQAQELIRSLYITLPTGTGEFGMVCEISRQITELKEFLTIKEKGES